MKKSLFLLPLYFLAVMPLQAQNDAITRFFEKYMDDERFTVVFVAPKMFQLVSKIETDDEDWNKVRDIVKDLGGLRVLTADSIADGLSFYKDALSRVPQNEYSELLTVRDGKENVRIWTKDSGNIIEELLLLVGSPDEFTMLSFTGKIDLDKISGLSKSLDVKGIEQLDKLKSNKSKD
ncbi:MAG: DUF4252 domain-containing protein [Lewinellaceae bacterium]|jgi:hypothetical protein|nr:DUF4252 domain-containing protein [Lewinellaceae bacterium]